MNDERDPPADEAGAEGEAQVEPAKHPGGAGLDGYAIEGCPCPPGGGPKARVMTAEGVACRCGRPVARWTGAPGVSDLALVDHID